MNEKKDEFTDLKQKIETNSEDFLGNKTQACVARYNILLPELRGKIKKSLEELESTLKISDNPNAVIEYRAKITRNDSSLTLTQFNNGTLLLQGKTNKLFDDCCDLIERITNPSDKNSFQKNLSDYSF